MTFSKNTSAPFLYNSAQTRQNAFFAATPSAKSFVFLAILFTSAPNLHSFQMASIEPPFAAETNGNSPVPSLSSFTSISKTSTHALIPLTLFSLEQTVKQLSPNLLRFFGSAFNSVTKNFNAFVVWSLKLAFKIGITPVLVSKSTDPPLAFKKRMASAAPCKAASDMAVSPKEFSLSTLAPRSQSHAHASALLNIAASCNGVLPVGVSNVNRPPSFLHNFMASTSPRAAHSQKMVLPNGPQTFTSTFPCSTRTFAVFSSFARMATNNGDTPVVIPHEFASAPSATNASTASVAPL